MSTPSHSELLVTAGSIESNLEPEYSSTGSKSAVGRTVKDLSRLSVTVQYDLSWQADELSESGTSAHR